MASGVNVIAAKSFTQKVRQYEDDLLSSGLCL